MNQRYKKSSASLLLLVAVQIGLAQEKDVASLNRSNEVASVVKTAAASETTGLEKASAAPVETKPLVKPQVNTECRLCRWIEIDTAAITARYRFIENSSGLTTNNQVQDNVALKGRFKFDAKGKYSINAGVFTGNGFTSGWNNTGIGTGHLFTNLYLKQLYLSAKPLNNVELQYGVLYINRG